MTKLDSHVRRERYDDVDFVFERVLSDRGEVGFSLTWPSDADPVDVLDDCLDADRAQAETDVIVSEIKTGREVLDRPLEQVSRDSLRKLAKRGHVVQFNAPFWSVAFWPADQGGHKVIEFTGSEYQSAVAGIVNSSLGQSERVRFGRWLQTKVNEVLD